jgi:hypothetical protein
MNEQTCINQFRHEVYQSLEQRADVGLDLIDALTSAPVVESPVAISESPLFRRNFSSVYDFLKHGLINQAQLRRTLYRCQPEAMESIAGYEVYAVDCTEDEHPEADTLPDRHQSRKGKFAPKIIGHRYSWVARLGQWRTSWCLPQDVQRVTTSTTDSQIAAEQVQELDQRSDRLKVLVADSLYGNDRFLSIFLVVTTVFALVRLRSNRVLYEEPLPHEGKRGRPRKHGAKFKLKEPSRIPDQYELFALLGQTVRLQAWHNLHFYRLPFLVGMVLRVEFLRANGTLRYQRPLYLFWTGPTTLPLSALCQMYLWRFAIEHMFRFLKQHMGLSASRSPALSHNSRWMWCCALAYTQLALMRHAVADQRPPWHPRQVRSQPKPMTPRQVQRVALPFLLALGTPAQPTQPAGKGSGRLPGYQPKPRQRHPVVKKGKNKRKKC